VLRKAGQARRASIDVDLSASGRAKPLALRLLPTIIGLDGRLDLFNIEQAINQE
jgi:hypothetical protein